MFFRRLGGLVAVLAVFTIVSGVLAEDDTHEHHQEQAHGKKIIHEFHEEPKPTTFKGYERHRTKIIELCSSLSRDYRSEKMFQMIEPLSIKDPGCVACRPMAKLFVQGCKPKVKLTRPKKDAPPTPTPLPVVRQREPNSLVLAQASQIFSAIAREKDILADSLIVIRKLVTVLRDPKDKSPAEREYFEILAEFIEAPFQEALSAEAAFGGNYSKDQADSPQINIDELF
ncbi:MAG: hypothetical protein DCC75_08810 [Proteobacteria bacterium]|nr:MAG: hypothetical protein DCC75_08810 [Pseudomonadota bacterium]